MKIMVIAVVAALLAASTCRANENPDKYPSVGVMFTETRVSDNGGSFVASRPVVLDLRVPVSDSVTVGFHGGPTTVGFSSRDSRSGFCLGASARVYLPFRLVRD